MDWERCQDSKKKKFSGGAGSKLTDFLGGFAISKNEKKGERGGRTQEDLEG